MTAWSGQVLFERWTIGLFNVLFTAAPPLAIGLFDRTASMETMVKFPSLYRLSQDRRAFSVRVFWMWICNAMYHSVLLFWLTKLAIVHCVGWANGFDGGWLMMGNMVYTYVVITVCIKAGLEIDAWVWVSSRPKLRQSHYQYFPFPPAHPRGRLGLNRQLVFISDLLRQLLADNPDGPRDVWHGHDNVLIVGLLAGNPHHSAPDSSPRLCLQGCPANSLQDSGR